MVVGPTKTRAPAPTRKGLEREGGAARVAAHAPRFASNFPDWGHTGLTVRLAPVLARAGPSLLRSSPRTHGLA